MNRISIFVAILFAAFFLFMASLYASPDVAPLPVKPRVFADSASSKNKKQPPVKDLLKIIDDALAAEEGKEGVKEKEKTFDEKVDRIINHLEYVVPEKPAEEQPQQKILPEADQKKQEFGEIDALLEALDGKKPATVKEAPATQKPETAKPPVPKDTTYEKQKEKEQPTSKKEEQPVKQTITETPAAKKEEPPKKKAETTQPAEDKGRWSAWEKEKEKKQEETAKQATEKTGTGQTTTAPQPETQKTPTPDVPAPEKKTEPAKQQPAAASPTPKPAPAQATEPKKEDNKPQQTAPAPKPASETQKTPTQAAPSPKPTPQPKPAPAPAAKPANQKPAQTTPKPPTTAAPVPKPPAPVSKTQPSAPTDASPKTEIQDFKEIDSLLDELETAVKPKKPASGGEKPAVEEPKSPQDKTEAQKPPEKTEETPKKQTEMAKPATNNQIATPGVETSTGKKKETEIKPQEQSQPPQPVPAPAPATPPPPNTETLKKETSDKKEAPPEPAETTVSQAPQEKPAPEKIEEPEKEEIKAQKITTAHVPEVKKPSDPMPSPEKKIELKKKEEQPQPAQAPAVETVDKKSEKAGPKGTEPARAPESPAEKQTTSQEKQNEAPAPKAAQPAPETAAPKTGAQDFNDIDSLLAELDAAVKPKQASQGGEQPDAVKKETAKQQGAPAQQMSAQEPAASKQAEVEKPAAVKETVEKKPEPAPTAKAEKPADKQPVLEKTTKEPERKPSTLIAKLPEPGGKPPVAKEPAAKKQAEPEKTTEDKKESTVAQPAAVEDGKPSAEKATVGQTGAGEQGRVAEKKAENTAVSAGAEAAKTAASPAPTPESGGLVIAEPPKKDVSAEKKEASGEKKPKVDIKGQRYLKFRNYDSTGSTGDFLSREGLITNGQKMEQGTDLSINAKVSEKTKLSGTFNEMPQQEREMMFKLEHGAYGATYGDFTAAVEGGAYAAFSKRITGIQFDYKTDQTKVSAVTSQSKSQSKTISFTGRNIKGPYDLNARDLLPDKATVQLNNVTLSSSDYVIDAFAGEITFNQILGPNDTVVINYEQRLTGNLNEGNITAFSADQTTKNKKLTYGFTRLSQQASRQSRQLTQLVEDEQAVSCGPSCIKVAHNFIVRADELHGSESIYKNGVLLEPNRDYNHLGSLDRYEILANYATGTFSLSAPIGTDSFKVTYYYYPDTVINRSPNELLYLDSTGSFGYPGNMTIYTGSEKVYMCDDAQLLICDLIPLKRGDKYKVDERLNRLTFTPPVSPGKYVKIDYYYYPDVTALESNYDHTVDDLRLKYKATEMLNFEYERATSLADVASVPIAVLNETVRAATDAELDCTNAEAQLKACTFSLANKGITAGSLVIYFNDRLSTEGVLSNAYYTADNSGGTVTFRTKIPANTRVIADYQYKTQAMAGLATGRRDHFGANYNAEKTQLKLSLDTGDTYFSPIGGGTNLEVRRLSYGLSQKIGKTVGFTADWMSVDNSTDILQTHKKTSDSANYNLSFSSKAVTQFRLGYDTRNDSDDYLPAQTDSTQKKLSFNLGMPIPFLKKADFTLGYTNSKFNDNTESLTQTKTTARTLGFNYQPTRKLMLTSQFTYNAVDTSGKNLAFTSKNESSMIGLNWTPIPLLMIATDIDKQSTKDSRPTVAPREISRSRISISTQPFGRVKTIQLSFMQQDSPSVSGPSSGTKTSQYQTGFILTKALTFTPSMTVAKTYVGDDSTTDNTSHNYGLEFRPPGKPYRAILTLQDNNVDSRNKSTITSSTSSGWNLALGYDPSPMWNYMATFQKDSFSGGGSSGSDTATIKTHVGRKTDKSNQWFDMQNIARSGSTADKSRTIELGTTNQLTKILSLNLFYRLSNFKNSIDASRGFNGHLIEGTFKASF